MVGMSDPAAFAYVKRFDVDEGMIICGCVFCYQMSLFL